MKKVVIGLLPILVLAGVAVAQTEEKRRESTPGMMEQMEESGGMMGGMGGMMGMMNMMGKMEKMMDQCSAMMGVAQTETSGIEKGQEQ